MGLLPQGASSILVAVSSPYLKKNSSSKVGSNNKYPKHEDQDLFIPPSSFGEGTQESCIVAEEEEQLEPEIAEFLAFLVPEEEYQLGLEIKDTKRRIQTNQESIKIWTKTVS